MFDKAIDIIYLAKQGGIDIVLNEEELHVKLPKNRSINSELIGEIKGNKQLIVDFLKSSSRASGNYNKIEKFNRNAVERIPASFAQHRMWFIDQLEGSTTYHIPAILRLKGKVKKEAVEYALKTVLERHEVLRTVIREENGEAFQIILDNEQWQLESINDGKYADKVLLQTLVEEFQSKPFDLSSDYMLRAALVTISEEEHVLMINMHHISSDGWSMSVLVKEVVELYSSFIENRAARLEPLPLQFADYSFWQHQYLKGETLDRKLGYWKKKLDGVTPLHLPTDNTRYNKEQLKPGTYRFTIDKELTEKLHSLSRENSSTIFMTLLAAFKVLLYNYSNQEDICIGTPIAGRQQPEIAKLIGNFVNTLVLRSQLNPDEDFTSLLQQVRVTTTEAYENQEIPFEKIVEVLPVERHTGKSPVFQVMFAINNTPEVPALQLGDVQLLKESFHHDTTKFDLAVTISETANALNIAFEYGAGLFVNDTIARMGANFKELLNSVVKNPEEKIGRLNVLTPVELHKVLVEFNNTSVYFDKKRSIVDLFEDQVQKTPDSIAVVFDEEKLTYKELNDRANQLARYLTSKGVQDETLVPICIERSLNMIIGIMGILKAGATYVPVDPTYPQDRISFMIDDTKAILAVSSKASVYGLQNTKSIEIIELDGLDQTAISRLPAHNLQSSTATDHLAYVIYTSGTTGKPKGVMLEHRSYVNINNAYHTITPGEQTIVTCTYVFDVSVLEIFSSLLGGGCLNIPSDSIATDPSAFAEFLYDRKISTAYIHPMFLKDVADALNKYGDCFLTKILIGVEPIRKAEVLWYLEKDIQIINGYGPTESTICATFYPVDKNLNNQSLLPIGKPIQNNQVFILNNNSGLTPIGVAGEIFIAGEGLARGYLNRAELTAEKFIKNPFSEGAGARLYKTGDLGRWLPDGNIEYAGRRDEQVKIRGYRIELGEIESVLHESGLVKQVVVLAKEDTTGTRQLVGYIVAEETFDKQALKAHLGSKLPGYMIPALWVQLENFPLTPNGKIDRKSLLKLEINDQITNNYTAPGNEVEKLLVEIWQSLLPVERIGVYDNFFELGGHSLLALRLISAIRKELHVDIPIKEVFANPTIAALSLYITASGNSSLSPSITSVEARPSLIPLSYSQERLWFMDQLEGSVEYHTPAALRLTGHLNIKALEQALGAIIDRHEVLRTVFKEQGGQPYQFIKEKGNWYLQVIEDKKSSQDTKGLRAFIENLISTPFDLSQDHMLRAHLITLAQEEHVLVVTMHHIASDAWSIPVIIKELAELYSSYTEGRSAKLAPLPLQYADYAIWQRNHLTPALLDQKISYWKAKLEGVSPLQLPTDYKRPAVRTTTGATTTFTVDKDVLTQLHRLSRQEGSSLYMTLLAAFKVLLYRYSGQEDISVGTSIANRTQQEVEGLIGFFVNTLAFRDEVKGDATFIDLLRQVRATTLGAYEHQEVSFEKVVEVVVKERDSGVSPLFQVMLVMQNTPEAPQLQLGELTLSGESFEHTISKFDLTFFINETAGGLKGMVQYRTDLFKAETIERMMSHFGQLLVSVTKEPLQKVGLLPLLSSLEEHQLLEGFNNSKVSYPGEATVVSLFEAQVLKTPGATAVVFNDEKLSFEELNAKANQVAHYLRQRGVKEDTAVPIYLERSLGLMTAIMGILKSGAAYVPVDTEFPEGRISYMLKDSGSPLVISSKASRSKLETAEPDIEIIEIDAAAISSQPKDNPATALQPHHLAYVIYTSGSTGMPKGVMIEHRNLVDYVFGLNQKTQIEECKSYALVSTTATDLGNTVIYSSLLLGGALHVFSKEQVSNIEYLHDYFADNRIDCLKIVPSHWKALSNEDELLLPKKLLVFGGEALQSELVEDIKATRTTCRVVNHYGPTETTVGKLLHVTEAGRAYNSTIPIGKPFSNTQVYVLSKELQPVPIGVPGQLYIAGHGVARGYLNNEELSRQKFIQNPFAKEAGKSVMYGTGDLVKYLADGNIEFIGRADDQVKIRGYRVETGEIESILQQSDLVSQAVVLARDDKQDNKRLVAYIVAEDGWFDREGILSYLKEKLPEYMVPAMLVELESLPLTPNGKVDRKALPDPEATEVLADQYAAPRNDAEARLAEIWQDVLEEEQIGVNDNFFELGGHSLLAVRLISAIRKEFAVEIPISHVFDYPTIALLAAELDVKTDEVILPAIEVIRPRPAHIPLSFSQERLWFIDRLEGSVQYHVPVVLKLQGNLNAEALGAALQQIVQRHEVLHTVFKEKDGEVYQVIQENIHPVLQVVNGSRFKDDIKGLEAYIKEIIRAPFNLSQDAMLRAHLVVLGEDDYVLVVTLHHIASDGWSRSILVGELAELYASATEHRSPVLQSLPVQYADFALWQRNYLQGELLDKKLNYWKEKLTGVLPLDLPTDHVRPAVQGSQGALISFNIDKELSAGLQQLSHKQGATLYMTLLSAFNVLLYRYSGQQDICVGTPIAGRQQQELEGLIGFFVNTLALRSRVDGDSAFTNLLQQVKATTMEAYANQEIPFEKVVEAVVKDRDMSRNPLFQVMFILRNTPDVPELRLGDVALSRAGYQHSTSLFDCSLFITETERGLHGAIEYSTELFTRETMERMAGHFTELLRSVVKTPEEKVGRLGLLTAAEEEMLLSAFNATEAAYPKDKSLTDLFEEQVLQTPHATAVVYEGQELTYQQLNERSNQLAHYLRSKGVKEETLVPICMERGIDLIAGIIGILKAGGAYVPIDPKYPAERIIYMISDTSADIIICDKSSKSNFTDIGVADIVELDSNWEVIKGYESKNPQISIRPDHLAYIIYTSGSTGVPKGTMIEHKSVVSLVKGIDYVSLTSEDILLSTGSPSFDATTFEYWGMLLNGGQLILCNENNLLDNDLLKEEIQNRGVNKMWFTSSWFNQLVDTDISVFEGLDTLLVGGEKLSEQHIQKMRITYPAINIINGYGPTENTTFSLTYPIKETVIDNAIPIGRPLSNRKAYIIDKSGELVAIGVTGEICLSGPGLARGYLNNADLTTEKFVANPFSTEAEAKMYKTGDLGCWTADGNILYQGRIDEQVKIRGYRIELGEVESVLMQSGLVSNAVVLASKDSNGHKRLVGYVVASERKFDKQAITSYLQAKLPEYMVPALWVEMESLPLTSNGKIDKRALPDPDVSELLQNEYIAPRNETEEKIVNIWQQLLGVERVGVQDNFFELGGHSLLAVRVVSAINKDLKVELTIKDLFLYPSVKELVEYIQAQKSKSYTKGFHYKSLVQIKKGGSKLPFYIVCGGGGTVFKFKKMVDLLDHEQPVFGLQQPTDLTDLEGFPETIEGIAASYVSEILTQNTEGPYALSGHCAGGLIALEMSKQLQSMGKKVVFLGMFDTIAPNKTNGSVNRNSEKANNLPVTIKKSVSKFYSKIDFEMYLLTRHTKHAIQYKIISLKSLIKKIRSKNSEENVYTFYRRLEKSLKISNKNYKVTNYNGNIVAYYAKDHYQFYDFDRNVRYRKYDLDENIKKRWNEYADLVEIYEVEGEHSTMFDPAAGGKELARLLQEHLNRNNLQR